MIERVWPLCLNIHIYIHTYIHTYGCFTDCHFLSVISLILYQHAGTNTCHG